MGSRPFLPFQTDWLMEKFDFPTAVVACFMALIQRKHFGLRDYSARWQVRVESAVSRLTTGTQRRRSVPYLAAKGEQTKTICDGFNDHEHIAIRPCFTWWDTHRRWVLCVLVD